MPPTHTDEGLAAAETIRRDAARRSGCSCSRTTLTRVTRLRLLEHHPERAGYLLKERVSDVAVLIDALHRINEGECVIDPTIVARLLDRTRATGPLDRADCPRARGARADRRGPLEHAICAHLFLSPKTVEAHVQQIFLKLGLGDDPDAHRRVGAVLAYLRAT